MGNASVVIFRPFPFEIGQKIFIEAGPRKGDWEVIGVTDRTVSLRCPFSKREFEWHRFCYAAETRENEAWPHPE